MKILFFKDASRSKQNAIDEYRLVRLCLQYTPNRKPYILRSIVMSSYSYVEDESLNHVKSTHRCVRTLPLSSSIHRIIIRSTIIISLFLSLSPKIRSTVCFIYAAIHSSDTMSIGLLTDILADTVVYFIFIYHGCVKIVPYAQFLEMIYLVRICLTLK